jgi:dihydrolipoamide dehydrogenase
MRTLDFGKNVCLVERQKPGGAGIHNGALSSKTLWELSVRYERAICDRYGYNTYGADLSYAAVKGEMRKAVNEKYVQLRSQIDYFVREEKLTYLQGNATMAGKHHIKVDLNEGKEITIESDHTVLAIGSRPRRLPEIPIDDEIIVTSDHISSFDKFPKSIVILGAGVIGCEFATIFSNFKRTKVFLIDKADRILPFEDEDVAQTVSQGLEANGVHIHRGASLETMDIVNGKVVYKIKYDSGKEEIRTVEKALVSVGRVPNSDSLGLEELGMELNSRGFCIDSDTQTSIPNIYAVGDFTADIALVNIAELEGRHAVERIYGTIKHPLKYDNISTIMFLNPEVAAVGLNETQASKQGIPYRMAKMKYKYVNRAIAMRSEVGFIKLLVSDDEEMRILGMRVLGDHASSAIQAIALLISQGKSVRSLVELIHPHPSIPEGIQECARMLMGSSIIKPEVFNMDLECCRVTANGEVESLNTGQKKTLTTNS